MWQDILKVQVLDTTTGLSTINEPMMEDKNCCELAREKFLEEQANYFDRLIELGGPNAYSPPNAKKNWIRHFEEMLAMTDCKTFREVLQDMKNKLSHLESSIPYKNALRFWEECEK